MTPNGDNVIVIGVNLIKAVAQAAQERVKSLFSHPAGVFLPDCLDQSFAADDLAGVFNQQRQQVELLRRERGVQLHAPYPNAFRSAFEPQVEHLPQLRG